MPTGYEITSTSDDWSTTDNPNNYEVRWVDMPDSTSGCLPDENRAIPPPPEPEVPDSEAASLRGAPPGSLRRNNRTVRRWKYVGDRETADSACDFRFKWSYKLSADESEYIPVKKFPPELVKLAERLGKEWEDAVTKLFDEEYAAMPL